MKMPDNTLSSIKAYFKNELISFFDALEIDSMFFIVAEHYFNITKKDFILTPDKRLSESDLLKIIYCVKGLKTKKPLAYILGEWEFFGLKFKVSENTLIPRPETEELVDIILKENEGELSVLDIGTGTGCIPIALKKQNNSFNVLAMDVSAEALSVAKGNALLNKVEVEFLEYDILKNRNSNFQQQLDVIVSNPPYIPESNKVEMDNNVLDFEPHLALFVANHEPLLFYDAITDFAKNNLKNKGKLYFEIHEKYGKETLALIENKGFSNVKLIKDINGKDRMVSAQL